MLLQLWHVCFLLWSCVSMNVRISICVTRQNIHTDMSVLSSLKPLKYYRSLVNGATGMAIGRPPSMLTSYEDNLIYGTQTHSPHSLSLSSPCSFNPLSRPTTYPQLCTTFWKRFSNPIPDFQPFTRIFHQYLLDYRVIVCDSMSHLSMVIIPTRGVCVLSVNSIGRVFSAGVANKVKKKGAKQVISALIMF